MFERIVYEARLVWRLLLDTRVSMWHKLIVIAAVAYVLSPLDLIPDFMIGLGQLDDLGILLGSLRLFKSMIPTQIVQEHQEIIDGRVIEARKYKVNDRD
ncbi:MAG: DUF1232 domain-containing protein [Anaerolineae bacterium]|nr:DUF1232 domain-containing protein [Anaerolineae bacterium]